MAVHNSGTKTNARMMASRFRRKGFVASVFKKKKGYGVSVTRK
jgi:hypothetical protein